MGCSASKSTAAVVVSMPNKSKENVDPKQSLKEKEADSLRGSQSSIRSCSTASRSDREASAKSTRTTDSGVGELEEQDDNIITEHSSEEEIIKAKANERPTTPGQCVYIANLRCLYFVFFVYFVTVAQTTAP